MNLQRTAASVGRFVSRNSPTILTALSVAGLGLTAYLTGRGTARATDICRDYQDKKKELDKQGYLRIAKEYIPAVVSGASTIFCVVSSNAISIKRIRSLGGAYAVLDTNFRDYKAATIAAIGTDAANKIQEAADKVACEKNVPKDASMAEGQFIFYDRYSRRDFISTPEDVIAAEYALNRNYILRGYATLNEFYSFLGLPEWESGDILGWSPDEATNYGYEWIDFVNVKHEDPDGLIWYSIEMIFEPTIDGFYYSDWVNNPVDVAFGDE